jgi:hypothetical protein
MSTLPVLSNPSLSDIEHTHAYLAKLYTNVAQPQYDVTLASQCRSLKAKIENHGPMDTADAETCLERLREGPWSGLHIHTLSTAIDACVHRYDKATNTAFAGDRKPQRCDNIETFFTDRLWELSSDTSKPRSVRIQSIVEFSVSMDLTNPNPQCKQRIVAILGLTDGWIVDNATNAKVVLQEVTDAFSKYRPHPRARLRAHVVEFPMNPSDACAAIDDFAERVYGADVPSADPPYTTADIDNNARGTILRWSSKAVRHNNPNNRFGLQGGGSAGALMRQQTSPTVELPAQGTQHQGMGGMPGMMGGMGGMMGPQMQMMQQMMMPMAMMQMQMMQQMGMQPPAQGMGGMPGMMGGMEGMMGGMGCGQGMLGGGEGDGGAGGRGGGGGRGAAPGYYPGAGSLFGKGRAANHDSGRGERAAIGDGAANGDGHAHTSNPAGDDGATDAPRGEEDELATLEQTLAKQPPSVPKCKAKATAKGKAAPEAGAKPACKRPASAEAMHASPEAFAKAKVVANAKAAAKAAGPAWGYEESRKQVMCRTGLSGPGQSHAIKYEIAGGKAKAINMADAWVAKKRKAMGFKS